MKHFQKTYDNGLRLILEKNDRPITAVNIMFFVGSQNEEKHEEGYAHFIEHMIFKSSENYSTNESMDKFAMLGADYNAYTSKTVTRFVFKCINENFEEMFRVYSDLILKSKFQQDELDKEREVVVEEMKKCQDDPVEIMYEEAVDNFYFGNKYAHDALGTEENILNVTREQLLSFKNKYYRADNCIISVVGNIDFDKLDKIVSKWFSNNFKENREPYKVDFSRIEPNIKDNYKIITRDDKQANVCILIKAPNYASEQKYIADIYASILGNTQNSKLFKKIREELGLVYHIYASCEVGARIGEVVIVFGTRPKNVKKAICEIKNILNELAEKGITEEELEYAKIWKKSITLYSEENSSQIASLNASMVHYHDRPLSSKERMEHYDKIKTKDVCEFAKQIANEEKFAVVAVGSDLKLSDLKSFKN